LFPQTTHFFPEEFQFREWFSAVLASPKELQIGQSIVLFVAVDMVDKLSTFKASAETLGDNKAVFINSPSLVCHRKIWTV
jgi:hypothetical protein